MKHKVMKTPSEIIFPVQTPPEPESSPAGKIAVTVISCGYLLFLILLIFLAARDNSKVTPIAVLIFSRPLLWGQFCRHYAKGSGTYAYIASFISVGITVFEAVIMITAAMAFFVLRTRGYAPEESYYSTYYPQSYSAADISRLTIEVSNGINTPKYYVYTVDMENRTAARETYSFKRGGEYAVSESITNSFSEEKAAEFSEYCDEVLITKWNDVYMPERENYEGLDEMESIHIRNYSISRGGYRKYSLEYKDGCSHDTIMYDHAKDVPNGSSRVISKIYSLLVKE